MHRKIEGTSTMKHPSNIVTVYIASPPVHFKLSFFFLIFITTANSCLAANNTPAPRPSDVVFQLPSPLPTWPSGSDFATGVIDLGGLQVRRTTSFRRIWTAYDGGLDNVGAISLEPSAIPDGFSRLGCYAQPNNRPLSGWVLVGKTDAADESGDILKQPTDYTLISPKDLSGAYFWLPTPPDGYKAVGVVVTASSEKPPLGKIRCVRSDFTDEAETESLIWGNANGVNVYGLRPKTRGTNAKQVSVGTFTVRSNRSSTALPLSCLKNKSSTSSAIPNQAQIEAVFQAYAPYIYFHPREIYLPSSVNWYFSNGALLYTKGDESNPVRVQPNGSNLPQGGSDDGSYWLDLPAGVEARSIVQKGDLKSTEAYLHIKPILGGTATDIQVWMFYPFNGPATAKLGLIEEIKLGKIGQHVGDWEHVTLRISNFDGILLAVYFAAHSGGRWVDSSELVFQSGNRFVVYSSLNGHAAYEKAGVMMQGGQDVGIRNDAAKSDMVMDTAARFLVVAAAELPWLNYYRKWGPTRSYDYLAELDRPEKLLQGNSREQLEKLLDSLSLPNQVFGEYGPTGPKVKDYWDGDER